ncbi:MAG: hypothetical protein K1X53_08180 [Candidatus Sumerlaeaceae bacterium]|nr:hypothetical protein [Candidatus Sumerlaeaceae bacterium]
MISDSAAIRQYSPTKTYLLVWLTLGVYWVYWLLRTMEDLNSLSNKRVFNLSKIVTVGVGIYAAIILSMAPFIGHLITGKPDFLPYVVPSFVIGYCLMIAWLVFVIRIHMSICRAIRSCEESAGLPNPATARATLLLFFLYFAAVPYLQRHLNRVVTSISSNLPAA